MHAALQRLANVAQSGFRLARIDVARLRQDVAFGRRETIQCAFPSTRAGIVRQWASGGRAIEQRADVESILTIEKTLAASSHPNDRQINAAIDFEPGSMSMNRSRQPATNRSKTYDRKPHIPHGCSRLRS